MAKANSVKKQWYLIDAENQVLGRMAVDIANILMGKHRPWYTPHIDTGDFVVVVNTEKLKVTGKKLAHNTYYSWSGYPGGLKAKKLEDVLQQEPARVLHLAVRRMLPKSKLGRRMLKKLKIYSGPNHPHSAQNVRVWNKHANITLQEVQL